MKDSFIFAFKGGNNIREPVLSRVKKYDEVLFYHSAYGPVFNYDLGLTEVRQILTWMNMISTGAYKEVMKKG